MSFTRRLVRLYPGCLRDRWGPDLEAEARVQGWRSWPNLVVHLLDMWLHPVVWPATSGTQRRGRAAVLSIAVALAGWWWGYVLDEQGEPLSPAVAHSWLPRVWDLLLLAGLALVAPCPRPTVRVVITVCRRASRRLAPPVLLAAAVLAGVHLGAAKLPPLARHAVLACWWVALAMGVVGVCQVVARLGTDVAAPPRAPRLRVGLGLLAAAFVTDGLTVLGVALVRGGLGPPAALLTGGLVLLTITCAVTLRDLRIVPATD